MLVNINVMPTLTVLFCLFSLNALADNPTESVTNHEVEAVSDEGLMKCQVTEQATIIAGDLTKLTTEQHFTLLGKAKFSVLFWDIYESSLLTTDGQQPFSNVCQHALFEIHYLRDISKKELIDNTVSQWQHLALNENEYRAFLPLLENIWSDINAGDRLSMLSQRGTSVFYLNRQKIGEIESLTFAKIFLSIWLDENTSEPKLRQQLLGNSI
ncbi:chalcone isomerase family protein [Colwellia sp. C1TZA3]|uniref:chalcone isomerase family protein n=1 Tax=Colwellia sp. C1TZA3 TaxID=2508879 RepID=UPI0011B9D80B|nr:chalcone isomerase family protein [Colwellia sp. C1TZA3]TWX69964.1 hypothetical protein ESZ39_11170 [Colwellia sp. C1TZA3]